MFKYNNNSIWTKKYTPFVPICSSYLGISQRLRKIESLVVVGIILII